MDAVLRNFKQIPCPDGDRCTKPACQWQHSWDKKVDAVSETASQVTSAEQSAPSAAPTNQQAAAEDEPRKRRRLSPRSEASSTKPGGVTGTSRTTSISPPPLKRKVPSQSKPIASPSRKTATVPQRTAPSQNQTQTPEVKPRKPEPLIPRHLKTPPGTHEFRCKAVKMLHDQFQRLNNDLKKDAKDDEQKLVLNNDELIWMALDLEQKVATEQHTVYANVVRNHIMAYKKMTTGKWKDERLADWEKKQAKLLPKTSAKSSDLGPPVVVETGLTRQEEVAFLQFLATPITKLAAFGYVPVPPSDEDIKKALAGEDAGKGWEKCDRCNTRFQVFPDRREEDGALSSGGECLHHHGRQYWPDRIPGTVDKRDKKWRCCHETIGESPGCITSKSHVFKVTGAARLAALMPFVETPPNPSAPKDRAVCFDCEMGYTARGMELIRLTATSWPDGKTILDVLVRPIGLILDLNSRYSGIWPEDIANAVEWTPDMPFPTPAGPEENKKPMMYIVPSPQEARNLLFSLISPETPLIGHGLENDLNAVRIVHPTVIDTIMLFPHSKGFPMRHALRHLMERKLNKRVQVEASSTDLKGHDSAEDARSAGELVRLKVMQEWNAMKLDGWKCVDGVFVPPGGHKLSEQFLEEGQVDEGGREVEEKIPVTAAEEYDPTRLHNP
ncbi:hypothetical protein QBC35DRAFT_15670 [Podospora australis]|uniref:Exonuclease domain-containing protein n=1 Tax=Podospora australis TaxID=1536484 RepID=A0AAN6X1D6_9PEZI|nr:hypothetical protein QBC35DRAFT_15670 [Podospora australis]